VPGEAVCPATLAMGFCPEGRSRTQPGVLTHKRLDMGRVSATCGPLTYAGRAKTSALWLAVLFCIVSTCAGFEPFVPVCVFVPPNWYPLYKLGSHPVFRPYRFRVRQRLRSGGCVDQTTRSPAPIAPLGVQTFSELVAGMAQTRRMGKATRKSAPSQSAEVFALPV
jgi:hypothetical protein